MQTRQLYAAITATSQGTTFIDLPRGSRIHKVTWAVSTGGGAPTTNDNLHCEISINSTLVNTTNDATGIISMFSASGFLTTSGAQFFAANFSDPVDVSLGAVTRIYLNALEAGAATWQVRALLHFT